MSLLEDLQKTYAFHLDNEWVRGSNRKLITDSHGVSAYGYCIVGGLLYGLYPNWPNHELTVDDAERYDRVRDALMHHVPEGWELMEYNDLHATDKEDITTLFKKAIAAEAARVGTEVMGGVK